MFLLWIVGGAALYFIAREDKTFLVKHMIAGIAIILVVSLIPIISLLASLFVTVMGIVVFFSDGDKDAWYNQPASKKNK